MLSRAGGIGGAGELPPVLGRDELERERFPVATCEALFAAVLVDDEVDSDARLPAAVRLDYAPRELAECFRLCRQLWYDGFDRAALLEMIETLRRDGDLGTADRLRFKHIRAKFKHFRYAHALYGADHHYPWLLDRVTITMGKLQDASRTGRRRAVRREALLLRLLLGAVPTRRLRAEADRLRPTTPAAFRALLEADAEALRRLVAHDRVDGHHFHAARKRIGRQVSFWDTLRTLWPSPERFDMSRSLSAINGLMGELHDRMVERRGEDRGSYAEPFVLPAEIRDRIEALLGVFDRVAASSGLPIYAG